MNAKRKPSEGETAILQILWEDQPCSVKEVHERLQATKTVRYTTTLKQMQRLFEKGLVTRTQGPGKSYLYSTTEAVDETRSKLFNRLVENAFGNSVSGLVMHALGKGNPTEDEIEEIRAFLNALETEESSSKKGG